MTGNKKIAKILGILFFFIFIVASIIIINGISSQKEERIVLNKKLIVEYTEEKLTKNEFGDICSYRDIVRDTVCYNENDSLFLIDKNGKKLYKVDTRNIRYIDFLTK